MFRILIGTPCVYVCARARTHMVGTEVILVGLSKQSSTRNQKG